MNHKYYYTTADGDPGGIICRDLGFHSGCDANMIARERLTKDIARNAGIRAGYADGCARAGRGVISLCLTAHIASHTDIVAAGGFAPHKT